MMKMYRCAWFLVSLVLISQYAAAQQEDTATVLDKAHQALEHARFNEAIQILAPLVSAQPPVKGAQHELGFAYYRSSHLDEARVAFAHAIQDDATDSESVQMEGLTLYRMGHFAEAIPYLERVRQWMPHANADASYVLGLCYLNAREFEKARRAFSAQFVVPPDSAQAYLLLAQMLLHAQMNDEAAAQASLAIQHNPNLPLAHFVIGEAALAHAQIEAALAEFEQERKLNPGYPTLYERLGDAYARLDRLDDAQQALTRAIALERTSTGPYILMGKVLLRRNDPATALLYLRKAANMDPNNAIVHILLGQAYTRTGQQDAAKREAQLGGSLRSTEMKKP